MKKVLIGIAVIWALAAAALLVVPRLSGTGVDYRGLLIAQIEARTGRKVTIDGDVTMRLLPTPELTARDVHIASIDGAPSSDVIKAPLAVFKLDRTPLAIQKLKVTEVILDRPKIYLDELPDGRRSWDFQSEQKPGKKKPVAIDGVTARDATILYRKGEGQMTLSGALSWNGAGARPVVKASLKGGQIDLDPFFGPADSGPAEVRAGGKRWSETPMDLDVLREADGRIEIAADALHYRRYQLSKPSITARLEGGQLHIEKAAAGLFGGEATLGGTVDARAVPAVKLDVALTKASVDKALSDWADTPFASGRFRMTANLRAQGETEYAMIQSLSGTVLLEASDGVVRGFDSARLSTDMSRLDRYADFIDLADTAMSGGQSRYTRMGGGVRFENGIGGLDDFTAAFDGSRAAAQGSIDLPRWAVDIELAFSLTGEQNAKAPPVTLTLNGALDAPEQKTHLGAAERYLGKKLVKTVIDDALGKGDPRGDDLSPEERKEKTKRVMGKLIDKLERRRDRVTRHHAEPDSYDDGQYGSPSYPDDQSEDQYRSDEQYPSDGRYEPAPSYRLDPGSGRQGRPAPPVYRPDPRDDDYEPPPAGQGYQETDPDPGYQQGYGPGPYYGPLPGYDGRY